MLGDSSSSASSLTVYGGSRLEFRSTQPRRRGCVRYNTNRGFVGSLAVDIKTQSRGQRVRHRSGPYAATENLQTRVGNVGKASRCTRYISISPTVVGIRDDEVPHGW